MGGIEPPPHSLKIWLENDVLMTMDIDGKGVSVKGLSKSSMPESG
jgi:hypothetical protein